jgi:transcriptional regulator with XRE-family HTH domain
MAAASTPLEKTILLAMKKQGITAADLAVAIGMAPTNFSLARHNQRGFPLPALLRMCGLAEIDADGKIKLIEWIAFKQDIVRQAKNRQ